MRRLLIVLLAASSVGFVTRGGIPCDALQTQPSCLVGFLPGPTQDALELIDVVGETSESEGALLMTTVSVDVSLTLRDWIAGWFDPQIDQIDRELIYPEGSTVEDVRLRNDLLMEESELDATIAALRALGMDAEISLDGAEIVEVTEYSTAGDVVEVGDVIVGLEGAAVSGVSDVIALLARFGVGDEVELEIRRDDQGTEVVAVELVAAPDDGRPVMGVSLRSHVDLPVDVTIDAGDIGGPSAGMMFALAIVDRLTPQDLTGGRIIAGTGEIDREGTVGRIGGIRQKIAGAASRGDQPNATVFLVPAGNFDEALTAAPDNEIMLVPVATLAEALDALAALRADQTPAGAVVLGG